MSDDTETVGAFTFSVAFREPEAEARERFERRAETLAAWLLSQWQKQHKEVQHDCHSQAG
jgi:hypothetical protein